MPLQTFATYCLADTLSNFLQHPTQKMDYGFLNPALGREVDQPFWGTRIQHIVGVAACLAATDHASQAAFCKVLKTPSFSFAKHPAAFVAHTFIFIGSGVMVYCAADAAVNPTIKDGERLAELKSNAYATYVGTSTAWYEPYVAPAIAGLGAPKLAAGWAGSALIPATLAYATVKGCGWNDWGNSGLNALESKWAAEGQGEKK
tara:strand:+ start:232 stop:840 length:609 start_codon:yes stop_codon:yes gene_type:complete